MRQLKLVGVGLVLPIRFVCSIAMVPEKEPSVEQIGLLDRNLTWLRGHDLPNPRDHCFDHIWEVLKRSRMAGIEIEVVPSVSVAGLYRRLVAFDAISGVARLIKLCPHPSILFLWEPPTVVSHNYFRRSVHKKFARVFTLLDDLIGCGRYEKFYEPQPSFKFDPGPKIFSERKLCTMLSGSKRSAHPRELYTYRERILEFFAKNFPLEFDFYGFPEDGEQGIMAFGFKRYDYHKTVYKGYAASKAECYKNYKFAICYENMRGLNGYLTAEKVFFCLMSGCVPVYWGAPDVEKYLPRGCFIDRRDFNSEAELVDFMHNFTEGDYKIFLQRTQDYLEHDPRTTLFSNLNFVDIFIDALKPGYDREQVFTPDELVVLKTAKQEMFKLGHLTDDAAEKWGIP